MDNTYHKHEVRTASAPFPKTVTSVRMAVADAGFVLLPQDEDVDQEEDFASMVAERERSFPALPAVYVWQIGVEEDRRNTTLVSVTFKLRASHATWAWLAVMAALVTLSMVIEFAAGIMNAAIVVPLVLGTFLIAIMIGKVQHARLEAEFWQALGRKIPVAARGKSWSLEG